MSLMEPVIVLLILLTHIPDTYITSLPVTEIIIEHRISYTGG